MEGAMNDSTEIRHIVKESFAAVHDGRSVDDVVIDDRLNLAFIQDCQRSVPNADPRDLNQLLFNLRKAGQLGPVSRIRTPLRHDDYVHVAEIAARAIEDKYGDNIDRVFCDPTRRAEFDQIATEIDPSIPPYHLRKAALCLRKGRRLRPELIKRIADWDRQVHTYSAANLTDNPDLIPRLPGIYIFRDSTGYLYIGEAGNLRLRVQKHLDHSDRKALARHLWESGFTALVVELHVFSKDSDGAKTGHRRAYESDLIARRTSRFNAKP